MKKLVYKVEVRYTDFRFEDAKEAMVFAQKAKLTAEEEVSVEIKLIVEDTEEAQESEAQE